MPIPVCSACFFKKTGDAVRPYVPDHGQGTASLIYLGHLSFIVQPATSDFAVRALCQLSDTA